MAQSLDLTAYTAPRAGHSTVEPLSARDSTQVDDSSDALVDGSTATASHRGKPFASASSDFMLHTVRENGNGTAFRSCFESLNDRYDSRLLLQKHLNEF